MMIVINYHTGFNKELVTVLKYTLYQAFLLTGDNDVLGYVWSPVVEVNMFSSKSVHEIMENVMLTLCRQGVKPEEVTVDTVDDKFREELLLPDPCLGLVFGPTLSTFGFMPWQIRVTEFS